MATTSAPPISDRMLASLVGSLEIAAVALGHRLGWYGCLAGSVPPTAAELAEAAGTDVRYTRPTTGGSPCPTRTGRCWSTNWIPPT